MGLAGAHAGDGYDDAGRRRGVAREGRRDVVAHHRALRGLGDLAQRHRAGQHGGRPPVRTAVRRGDVTDLEPAGTGAGGVRVEVVTLPPDVRHAWAFCQLIEAIPGKSLPKAGGCGATVVVTMTLEQLLAGLHTAGVCALDTGGQITAAAARRLACAAGIIPTVLDGKGQVLDLGRKSRGYSEPQRIAMGISQRGCTAEGCEKPPSFCHAHHDISWSEGGRTDLKTGRLLCGHHHRRIHDPAYRVTRLASGKVTFHRRT